METPSDHRLKRSSETLRKVVKNKNCLFGASIIAGIILLAALAPLITPYSPIKQDMLNGLKPPSAEHLLGTDILGRDIFSRILYGAQVSILIAIESVSLALFISVLLGSISGFYGGKLDLIAMRVIDIVMAFPSIMLAIALMVILGRGLTNLIVVIAISEIPIFTRLIRAATMSVKQEEYVLAAKATGESDLNVIFRYILPNCLSLITVQATLRLGTSVLTAAGLGFLGIGIMPPTPEWGAMMSDARGFLSVAPHTVIAPGLAIVFFVLGFNFFGDGLNDVLNPKSMSNTGR